MFDREYSFKGRHAVYVKNLVDDAELFNRNIDVYMLAPVVGFLYGRTADVDKTDNTTTKIFTDVFLKEQTKLVFIYRLLLLLDEKVEKVSAEQRIDRAFRTDNDQEAKEKNMVLFDSYVLGGIEYLHEQLFNNKLHDQEFIDGLFEFMYEFNEDLLSRTSEEDIYDILNNYK